MQDIFDWGGDSPQKLFSEIQRGAESFENFIDKIASSLSWLSTTVALNTLSATIRFFQSALLPASTPNTEFANTVLKSEALWRSLVQITNQTHDALHIAVLDTIIVIDTTTRDYLPSEYEAFVRRLVNAGLFGAIERIIHTCIPQGDKETFCMPFSLSPRF